jgi:hypothetical protein
LAAEQVATWNVCVPEGATGAIRAAGRWGGPRDAFVALVDGADCWVQARGSLERASGQRHPRIAVAVRSGEGASAIVTELGRRGRVAVIPVVPMSRWEVAILGSEVLMHRPDDGLVEAVFDAAGGHPLTSPMLFVDSSRSERDIGAGRLLSESHVQKVFATMGDLGTTERCAVRAVLDS